MDMREKGAARKADEILKKFAEDMVAIYDDESAKIKQEAEDKGIPDLKLRFKKRKSMKRRVLDIAAMFLVVLFIGSIVIPTPEADAWRVWWLDLILGENSEDIEVNNENEFKYYVSELPEGFTFAEEEKNVNRHMIKYVDDKGKTIVFTQNKDTNSEKNIDNENLNYSKEMIGDFEVLVGLDAEKIEFQFCGEGTIMTVSTNASYEVGKEFIENIKEL